MSPILPFPQLCAPTLIQAARPVANLPEPCTIPVYLQCVPAGFPSPADDYAEEGLDLNAYLIAHKASTFIFKVKGDSMSGIGILDGDKVVVDRSVDPRHKHIVIALINNDYTIKRLYKWAGVIELRAENPAYPAIRLQGTDELRIWGVVVGALRRFKV